MKKSDTIKLMIDSLADDRPKLFIFETEKEEIEINDEVKKADPEEEDESKLNEAELRR